MCWGGLVNGISRPRYITAVHILYIYTSSGFLKISTGTSSQCFHCFNVNLLVTNRQNEFRFALHLKESSAVKKLGCSFLPAYGVSRDINCGRETTRLMSVTASAVIIRGFFLLTITHVLMHKTSNICLPNRWFGSGLEGEK